MCSSLSETKMSSDTLKRAGGEMTKIKEELFKILAKLKEDEFKNFKWFLKQDEIPVDQLEKAEKGDTVDLMVQKYQESGALQLTMKVLEKINRNDLVQLLEKFCSGPKGEERNIGATAEQTPDTSAQSAASRSTPPTVYNNNELIRIVMVGKTGVGKSATGNTILGKPCFKSELCPKSVTEHCGNASGEVDGQKVAVIDTPGLFDTMNTEEKTSKDIAKCLSYASPGPHIFLVVIKLGLYTKEEKQTVQKIQKIFGEEANKYSMVLFTHGDLLKGRIEEFLNCSEDLQELVAKYNNQHHVFNNEVKDRSQVSKLLKKIKIINVKNGGNYYTTEMFQKAERAIEEEKQQILKEKEEQNHKDQEELLKEKEKKYQQQHREVSANFSALRSTSPKVFSNNEPIRIVLVGKTGAGKSTTGNTILGQKSFKSEFSFTSLTKHCAKASGEVDGQKVAVIDTPGLFDTMNTEEKTSKDIAKCLSYASPGPHIFLVVIKLGLYTKEEKQTVQKIQKIFGEEANKYSMVLFTHGDLLKGRIEEFLNCSEDLQELVAKYNNQHHVFNNEVKDRSQVSKLLKKIKIINVKNGGNYYTTEMFQKAERAIEEEKQQILKEKEEQNHKDQEELLKEKEKKYQQQHREVSANFSALRSTSPKVFSNNEPIRIVLVGKTGAGKSTTGNTILGQKSFKSEFSFTSLTKHCAKASGEVDGQKVAVIDTPGLFDTMNTEERTVKDIYQCLSYASPGPHIFLVVIRLGSYTKEEKQTVQKIQKIFGEEAYKYSMVLFTHGDLLKGKPIEEFLNCSEDLQELVDKYNNQYHVFNNEVEDRSQVRKLLKKIRNINVENGGSYYTTEMFQKAERAIEEEKQRILKEKEEQMHKEQEKLRKDIEEQQQQPIVPVNRSTPCKVFKNNELIRIVMVGKSGAGKSATGNTILGQKCFESEFLPTSLTRLCEKAYGEVDGQKVAVIDTPGLFDTMNTEEETVYDIAQSISYASPGPHIFLIVIKLGRFTKEEKQTMENIQRIFGEEAYKYSMVLFTHGDLLKGKPIEEFLKYSKGLQELVAKCNNQYHVFNNEVKDHSQVRKLLEKIRNINEQNGGSYYTTDMFQRAERVIEEERQRILKQREEQNCKEQEEQKKIEEKFQRQLREMEAEREKENKLRAAQAEREKQRILKGKEKDQQQNWKKKCRIL